LLLLLSLPVPAFGQGEPHSGAGVTVTEINEHLFKLGGTARAAVNLVVSSGPDGKLLVDAGRARNVDHLIAAVDTLGAGRVKYIISTHSDSDHNGGNNAFGDDVIVIAHENTAGRLSGAYFELPPLPGRHTPNLRVMSDFAMTFNGEEIRFIHVPRAHTDGDLMAFFTKSRVLVLGDLLLADLIAFVHPDFGGDALNYVDNLKSILDTLPGNIMLIPGHGPTYDLEQLREYYKMLEFTSERVREGRERGETAEDVLSDERLNRWIHWNGNPVTTHLVTWIPDLFRAYTEAENGPLASVCAPMTELILAEGVDAAVGWYREARQSSSDRFGFGVGELNNLGYHLLWRDRLDDAIEIFKLNIEAYPENANVYDSMGEGYKARGDTEQAIKNYERSLEIDPTNDNARAMLAELHSGN
jgi:glyoxylase-like metal-dependent hydrolase (beta-lactamase superfamily II)